MQLAVLLPTVAMDFELEDAAELLVSQLTFVRGLRSDIPHDRILIVLINYDSIEFLRFLTLETFFLGFEQVFLWLSEVGPV